jgi:hypothetical protein
MDVNEKWAALQTMTQEKWNRLRPAERAELRSDAGLTKQLIGCEGWRVEVEDYMTGEKRRFIVSRSTGWIPCHIEMKTRKSMDGISADREYRSVRKLCVARSGSQIKV